MMRARWLLLAGALTLLSCNEDPAPVKTAKAFASAARGKNVEAMLGLVDAGTRAFLEQASERASDQIGGRRNVEPVEMLQVVDVDDRFMVERAELVDESDTTAHVKLIAVDGTEHMIELVREEEAWRVRLPLPTSAAVGPPGEVP